MGAVRIRARRMHEVVLTVFAVTVLLALVSLVLPVAARVGIPYAVLLAVTGSGLGVLVGVIGPSLEMGPISQVLAGLSAFNLTSEAFLYIFLPTLLFAAALTVDVPRLLEEIAPVLLLAIVAVLVSTFVIGLALWPVAEVGLIACLMLGAILATTDPVAVIAIFRDIGAPHRLTLLVEGESLFNDAAAIALFTLLAAMLVGDGAMTPSTATLHFVREFVGGALFGFVVGRLTCLALPLFRDHPMAETTLTVALAYLAFIIGEHYVHVSGVVAVVTAGLVLSDQGRRVLSPTRWKELTGVWHQLDFWASSLIFLLAAMLVPRMLAHAGWNDLVLLGVVVAAAFGARVITLFGLLPLLTAAGLAARVRHSHKVVMLWGGMRGAVSLALALAVTENAAVPPEIRQFVAILATGFVLFTLLVNAPTLRAVIRMLSLDRLSPAELALRDRAIALSRAEIRDNVARTARDIGLSAALADEVVDACIGPAPTIDADRTDYGLAPDLRAYSGLSILAEREEELCLHHVDARTLSRRAVTDLVVQVARLRDGAKAGGLDGYLAAAEACLALRRELRAALALQRRLGITWPLARALSDRLEMLLALRVVLQDLARFVHEKVAPLLGEATAQTLAEAVSIRLTAAERAIAAIELQYPGYAETLQRQFLELTALRMEDESQRRLYADSIISTEVFNSLQRELRQRRSALEVRPRLDLGLKRDELVAKVELFALLPEDERAEIAQLLRPVFAVPGETIVRKGERGDSMYFISSGAVEVRIQPTPVQLGTGQLFGELALLDERPRNSDVVALGYCQLLSLSRRDLDRLLQANAGLRRHIHAVAEQRRVRA